MATQRATMLTGAQLAELRARARRDAGPFVDPRTLHRVGAARIPQEWAAAILGHPFPGVRAAQWEDVVLIGLALDAEPNPPSVAAARAAHWQRGAEAGAAFRVELAAWHALAARLPAHVEVVHNYTSVRHLEFFTQGVDHIMLREPLHVGRLHRDAGRTLCWTPSRAKDLQHFSDGYDDRIPECKACLRIAHRLATLKPATERKP